MGSALRKKYKASSQVVDEESLTKEAPAVDPRLPLTAREVYRLTSSWKAIKRNMEGTGVEMFVT